MGFFKCYLFIIEPRTKNSVFTLILSLHFQIFQYFCPGEQLHIATMEGNERGGSTGTIQESKCAGILLKIMFPSTSAFEVRRKKKYCEN